MAADGAHAPFAHPALADADADALRRKLVERAGRWPHYHAARIVTTTGTIDPTDDVLLVATAGGAVTLTLPVASSVLGRRFNVKKMDNSANNVTLEGAGTEQIDGANNIVWNTQYESYTVQACRTATPATYGWVVL